MTRHRIDPSTTFFWESGVALVQCPGSSRTLRSADALLPLVIAHFREPQALDAPPSLQRRADVARWGRIVARLVKAGVLRPEEEADDSSSDAAFDQRSIQLELAQMAHLVRELGTQMGTLCDADDIGLPRGALAARVGLAHELLDSIGRSFSIFARKRVAAHADRLTRRVRQRVRKLNLASGPDAIPGWVNIDATVGEFRQCLQWGLPFRASTVRFVFFAHGLEHLYFEREALLLLREIRRVLEPEGVARIIVPDIAKFLHAYAQDDREFFAARKDFWQWERRCRTPLEQMLYYCGASAQPHEFLSHKWGYDFATLRALLKRAGFKRIYQSEFMASTHEALRIDDRSAAGRVHHGDTSYSLFVEASR